MCFWRGCHLKNFNMAAVVTIWIFKCISVQSNTWFLRCNLKNFKMAAICGHLEILTEP